MEIPSTGDKLLNMTLQNLQKAHNDQLALIARLVGLTGNSISKALITDIRNISSEDRETLLAQLDQHLTQLKSNPQLQGVQQQIDVLEKQRDLLQSNLVKLIVLEINNKSFLVYTNQSLQKNQEISVRFVPNIGLELLSHPEQENTPLKQEQIIAQNLRQLLPLISHLPSQKHDNFYSALAKLTQILIQIPEKQLNQLLDKPLQTSLNKLNAAIPSLSKVIDPTLLKVIIEKSGIQFEKNLVDSLTRTQTTLVSANKVNLINNAINNLAKTPANVQDVSFTIPPTNTALKQSTERVVAGQSLSPQNLAPLLTESSLKESVMVNRPVSNNTLAIPPVSPAITSSINASKASPITQANADNINYLSKTTKANSIQSNQTTQDLKGALVELVAKTGQALAEEDADITSIIKNLTSFHIKDWATQLIPILMGKTPQKELSIKTLRTQLMALLQQHAYQTVAKIQIQQLQSLQPQTAQTSDATQQSWLLELPIRYQYDIYPMQMNIERRIVEDREKSNEQKREKIKQWRIMLSFDLPIVGHFYAQLVWINQQLNATLWAEKTDTLKLAREKMESLRTKLQDEGIQVTQLECLPGAPTKPQNQIQYSLIDITT